MVPDTVTSPRTVSFTTLSSRRANRPRITGQGEVTAESPEQGVGAMVVTAARSIGKVRAGFVSIRGGSPGFAPPWTRISLNPSLNSSSSTPAEYDDSRSSHDHPYPSTGPG